MRPTTAAPTVIFTQTNGMPLSRNMIGKTNIYQLLMPIFADLLIFICILETLVVDLKLRVQNNSSIS
jgi:hypothetical protein